ncbi:MAG: aldehyde dehydrogenase family protein [Actinobacteria bacterium]|nr:aldehyde dehydrogenase family protein [Actinomycetota bacterium]
MAELGLVDSMVVKAKSAQAGFEKFSQVQVDYVVKAIAKVVYDNAKELARMAVDETRMGNYDDKLKKKLGKARILWHSLKGKKSVGIIDHDKNTGIVLVAKPMGVIGAVTPCTNPVVTPMCNVMFALKGRNSVIIAPHPRAKKCGRYVVGLFNAAAAKYNTPANLIQIIEEPTIELTNELMKKVDVIIATGGMGMVKAAYSSGKPAYGVGVGNVQVIIDDDADIKEAIPKIVTGRAFDNGIICSAEQTVIVPEARYEQVLKEFEKNFCYVVRDEGQRNRLRDVLFIDGVANKDVIGQPASTIAKLAGVDIPEKTIVIVVTAAAVGSADLLCKEKMCPVLSIITYKDFRQAVAIAQANLDFEGKGHSVTIHSNNRINIEYAAENIKVSRFLINQICATSNGGSFFNGLAATTTLGCGSWGNNSISENLDYKHLINISRIAYFKKDSKMPTDDELWGDN